MIRRLLNAAALGLVALLLAGCPGTIGAMIRFKCSVDAGLMVQECWTYPKFTRGKKQHGL